MAQQDRTTLKGYFNTGDSPTEANFIDLIDSFFNFTDGDTIDNSNYQADRIELIKPGNTNGQNGNWRFRVNASGCLVSEFREGGTWIEWDSRCP